MTDYRMPVVIPGLNPLFPAAVKIRIHRITYIILWSEKENFAVSFSDSVRSRRLLAVFLGATGRLAFSPNLPAPLIGVLFALPLLTAAVLALTSEKVRASLLGIPPQLLVGLNAMRILGVLFLLDFIAGSLNGPFPFFAGLGDMITGALAIRLALSIARSKEPSVRTIAVWNAFGTLDLVVAVGLGITSAAGTPLQLIHAGVGSQAMQYLPLSLVPTVLVPFYLLTHGIVAAQLRVRSRAVHTTLTASSAQ